MKLYKKSFLLLVLPITIFSFKNTTLAQSTEEETVNCNDPISQQEMNYCSYLENEKLMSKLLEGYNKSVAYHDQELRTKANLSFKSWNDFQNAACTFEASFEAEGGSLAPLIASSCLIGEVKKKLSILDLPQDSVYPPLFKKPLSKIISTLEKQFRSLMNYEYNEEITKEKLNLAKAKFVDFVEKECDYRSELIKFSVVEKSSDEIQEKVIAFDNLCKHKLYFDVSYRIKKYKENLGLFKHGHERFDR